MSSFSKHKGWFFLSCFWLLPFCFFFWVACIVQVSSSPATLRIGMGNEPDTLNPLTASDAFASQIQDYVSDSLIERNRDTLEFEPKLAYQWEISENHLEYTFYLRENVRWHDGAPFTADDVVYSFQKIQDPMVEAPFLRVYYADVLEVKKLGPHTVKFIYKRPYFMGLGVCGGISLVPKHVFDDGTDFNTHPASRHPIGLGPYKFVEWKTNKKIVLERNEDYWGPKPEIRRLEFKIVTDQTIALQIIKKGELDVGSLRPIQWIRQTSSKKFQQSFEKYKHLSPGYNFIGWNNERLFFSDKRVRQAMTLLVNREKLLKKINFGFGKIVEGPFFVGSDQYDHTLPIHPYDPKQAVSLLNEAGWRDTNGDGWLDKEGRPFRFKFLLTASSKFAERMATILKEDLKNRGIDMEIERLEWAAFLGKIDKKDFDATSLGWSMGFETDPYQIWHSSQAEVDRGSNFISFKNAEVDRLIEQARTEFDNKKRKALYHRFQQIIYDEQPCTFLFANDSLEVVSKRFVNVVMHKTGLNTLEWKMK